MATKYFEIGDRYFVRVDGVWGKSIVIIDEKSDPMIAIRMPKKIAWKVIEELRKQCEES